ncbi:hypothetical protein N657DRAFT_653465 [Parathielavia appendiculata]|uniref:Uncharacterized protein n=1 Tax=Parathielavia appendiculata TaxID=2587402 RepID=A0AAN6Z6P1_9PEZI|nr:hypothetical protein N657DRAFT_653465 [Parathielavia appendiculata]
MARIDRLRSFAEDFIQRNGTNDPLASDFRDRTRATFGNSPPPPRQPAPCPEGKLNFHSNTRYVIRHGDTANTTIPVPEVVSSDWDRITIYIAQLQALASPCDVRIGRLDGQGAVLLSIIPCSGGPFGSLAELHHWLLGADCLVVFTHGDLPSQNIMMRDGHIYWDYALALRGLDSVDWKVWGSHLPSLFSKRNDLEYILMAIVFRLS